MTHYGSMRATEIRTGTMLVCFRVHKLYRCTILSKVIYNVKLFAYIDEIDLALVCFNVVRVVVLHKIVVVNVDTCVV